MAEQGHYDKLRSIIARCKWTFTKIMHREVYLAYHHIGVTLKETGPMFNKNQIGSHPFEVFSLKVLAALSENAADKNESLLLDDVIQKGVVKVTEKGTEAGISTYTSMILGKPRKITYKEMNVNRPFIFEIIEKHSGLRLFAGIVNEV